MTLNEYKEKNKLSNKDLAKLIGLTGKNPIVSVIRYLKSERIPHPRFMKVITEKTKGLVQPDDFYNKFYDIHKI
jgi:uncharacterized radical SAM superfamily Fe-S cluster-containing enzyme